MNQVYILFSLFSNKTHFSYIRKSCCDFPFSLRCQTVVLYITTNLNRTTEILIISHLMKSSAKLGSMLFRMPILNGAKTSVYAIFTGQPTLRLREPMGRMFLPFHHRFSQESLQPVPIKLIVTPYHVISSQGVCLEKQGRTGNREGSSRNLKKPTQLLTMPNLLNIVAY